MGLPSGRLVTSCFLLMQSSIVYFLVMWMGGEVVGKVMFICTMVMSRLLVCLVSMLSIRFGFGMNP